MVSWFVCLGVILIVYLVTVYVAPSPPDNSWYDPQFQRCSLTKTTEGKIVHITIYFLFLVIPSFFTLFFYGGIVVTLRNRCSIRAKRSSPSSTRDSRVVSTKSFVTISVILLLYYMSYFPALILRDIPALISIISRELNGSETYEFPPYITTATSLTFYISTFTDPIIYGIRSPYIFTGLKRSDRFCLKRFIERTTASIGPGDKTGLADKSVVSNDTLAGMGNQVFQLHCTSQTNVL